MTEEKDMNLHKMYTQGSIDAYYGRHIDSKTYDKYTTEEKRWYWKGYGDEIFGEKDYG